MRFVHSIQGAAAVRVATDEVVPEKGLVAEDLINIVGNIYNFTTKPEIPLGVLPALMLPYVFQSGSVIFEDGKFPVYQLVILQQGDIINSSTTDLADRILDDYMMRLDNELWYRFAQSKAKHKSYRSHVVVDFEAPIGTKIEALGKIENLLANELGRNEPFKLRRLSFGSRPVVQTTGIITLESFENLHFIIERRAGRPEMENRYYSAAPTTTVEHIRILEAIERELTS